MEYLTFRRLAKHTNRTQSHDKMARWEEFHRVYGVGKSDEYNSTEFPVSGNPTSVIPKNSPCRKTRRVQFQRIHPVGKPDEYKSIAIAPEGRRFCIIPPKYHKPARICCKT